MAVLEMLPAEQWDRVRLAHLLNRAGFGVLPAEVDAWSKLSLVEAVDRLVDWENTPDNLIAPAWTEKPEDLFKIREELRKLSPAERQEKNKEYQREQRRQLDELRVWWLEAMWRTSRPLQEKMTLFWHGHFATSIEKVKLTWFMWRQNQLFRENGNGNFRDLVLKVGRDPAMLIWLDGRQNKAGAANENYARELMELFTLGEGHYTEKDIQESARAFTGWVAGGNRGGKDGLLLPGRHDNSSKTFMGRTGNFGDAEIVDIILQQPRAAEFISAKIWTFFASENPSPEIVSALAGTLRQAKYELKPLLKQMFRSQEFYSAKVMHSQVKSPVVWMVGTLKALEIERLPRLLPGMALRVMGQDLFAPPSVKGWDGGRTWISTNTLLLRNNLVAAMIFGGSLQSLRPNAAPMPDQKMESEDMASMQAAPAPGGNKKTTLPPVARMDKVIPPAERSPADQMIQRLAERFYAQPLDPREAAAFARKISSTTPPSNQDLMPVVYAMLSSIRYQLN